MEIAHADINNNDNNNYNQNRGWKNTLVENIVWLLCNLSSSHYARGIGVRTILQENQLEYFSITAHHASVLRNNTEHTYTHTRACLPKNDKQCEARRKWTVPNIFISIEKILRKHGFANEHEIESYCSMCT